MSDIFDYESGKTEGMSENQVIAILKSKFRAHVDKLSQKGSKLSQNKLWEHIIIFPPLILHS